MLFGLAQPIPLKIRLFVAPYSPDRALAQDLRLLLTVVKASSAGIRCEMGGKGPNIAYKIPCG